MCNFIKIIKNVLNKENIKMDNQKLTEEDYIDVSNQLNIPVACIKAIVEVESSGSGFDKEGNIKLLFEGHIFYKYLKQNGYNADLIAQENPDICYKKWSDRGNTYTLNQFDRLKKAIKIDENIAYMSASYGLFQIMGFNYKLCGFENAKGMYQTFIVSEKNQLIGFCNFIKSNKSMYNSLIKLDWSTFAKLYNGPSYKQNKYDEKLKKAYDKYSK